jgi:hypothetical protein
MQMDFFAQLAPPDIGRRVYQWSWGLCGGWGWRESKTEWLGRAPQPCTEPHCLRELGHDGPHNPRSARC